MAIEHLAARTALLNEDHVLRLDGSHDVGDFRRASVVIHSETGRTAIQACQSHPSTQF